MKKYYRKDGFTLIEVLITILITVIISMVMANLLFGTDQAYRFSVSQSQNAMAAQNTMNAIVSELKYIDNLSFPNTTTPTNRVDYNINESISFDPATNSIVFVNNGIITRRLANGFVRNVIFQRSNLGENPQTITITLTVNGNIRNSQPLTTSTTVVLLNI